LKVVAIRILASLSGCTVALYANLASMYESRPQ